MTHSLMTLNLPQTNTIPVLGASQEKATPPDIFACQAQDFIKIRKDKTVACLQVTQRIEDKTERRSNQYIE